jgi:hypothetical protein
VPHSRRLVLNLERRDDAALVPFGMWDLTIPALFSIEDGSIKHWLAAGIPSSAQLSLSVPHAIRRASWDRCLYYCDPPSVIESFIEYTKRFASIEDLIHRTEILTSTQRIRSVAEMLFEQVKCAKSVATEAEEVTHPLTGEVLERELKEDCVPFHFATMRRYWKGVDAKEFYDFTMAFGKPDADAFLSAMFSGTQDRFTGIERLNDAILTLAKTRDIALFKEIINKWNEEQNLILDFGDYSRLVTDDGFNGHKAALEWCSDFVRSALQLEDEVKDFLFKA